LEICTLGILAVAGCSNITLLRIEELKQVQSHVDSLKMELSTLQDQIAKEQKQQGEMLRLIRADQQARFAQFEKEIAALNGNISESQARLSQIDEKTLEIKKRWDEKAYADSVAHTARNTEIENLFDIAIKDFTAGRYEIALTGFQELMTNYPDSKQAEDSRYWAAECYYVRKKYDEAMRLYKEYIKVFPTGTKSCVTLFKMGLIFEKQEQKKACNLVWTKLIDQCPDSEEAKAAKARM
jgi:tol-pal system protein YbgF